MLAYKLSVCGFSLDGDLRIHIETNDGTLNKEPALDRSLRSLQKMPL
jgi:hypothetical protein